MIAVVRVSWAGLLLFCFVGVSQAWAEARVALEGERAARRADALIEREVLSGDEDAGEAIDVASITDDETYLRRVTLDLIGELPTAEEITAFVLDPRPNKREALVDRLLADPRYGTNWGRYWRDVILYRRNDERALLAYRSGEQYLADSLNQNKPWDEIAREMLTATGNLAEDGQTILLAAQWNETEDRASEASRIFLGIQIQCAQCHDHKTDRWKREQFHELAAFFPRIRVRPIRVEGQRRGFELVSIDRVPPRIQKRIGGLEHRMPDLDDASAKGTPIKPEFFLSGEGLDFGATDKERRRQLADWITSPENKWFATAFVNRMWGELVGAGFYEPIDDLGPDREPVAPKTVRFLASQFVAHGYDVKWLMRTIVLTDAYQRENRPTSSSESDLFACASSQRLRADQLFSALTAALDIDESSAAANKRRGPKYGPARTLRGQFNAIFGFDPSTPADEISSSIPQALALMNSPGIERSLRATPNSVLGRLLKSTDDDEQVIVELYLRTLAREPSAEEIETTLEYVDSVGSRVEAFEDVLWALVNTSEFLHRQ